MRVLFTLALFSSLLVLPGCSGKKPGGVSSGPEQDDDDDTGSVDGGSKRRDSGRPTGNDDDEDDDTSDDYDVRRDGGYVATPTSTEFKKDATGAAGLSGSVLDDLKKGGKSCTAKLLYPYDLTIFPAGLTPPTIMWEGASDAAYIKLTYDKVETLEYEFAVGATGKGELRIPADDWIEIGRRTQGTPLKVTLTTKSGSNLSTCEAKWRIAQGSMTGSIYYNTYNHPDKGGMGAVMRLPLGASRSDVYLSYPGPTIPSAGPCISCHSVSFDGSHLAASLHNYTPFTQTFETSSYAISVEPEPRPTTALSESTFGAFTPDGKLMLSMGNPDCTAGSDSFPRSPNNFPLLAGPAKAELHDTTTAQPVAAKGLRDDFYMWMPQFSPKGDKVVFNHAKPGANGLTDRRELAVMDFDAATNTFSNLRVIVSKQGPEPSIDYAPLPTFSPVLLGNQGCTTPVTNAQGAIPKGSCTGPCYPAWPFFTPDGEGVIYSLINEPDFMLGFPGRDKASQSELWYVDIASQARARLDNANKALANADGLNNYYPTVLPVQVGGYFWLFWTSTRPWGHKDLGTSPGAVISNLFGGSATADALRKRIWVSALQTAGFREGGSSTAGIDISSPAFYLEGQSETGNVRAFAALNPCRPAGNDCTSGLDCCTGYCNIEKGAASGVCTEEPPPCSKLNERCEEDSNCCQPGPDDEDQSPLYCIGNFCGYALPPG